MSSSDGAVYLEVECVSSSSGGIFAELLLLFKNLLVYPYLGVSSSSFLTYLGSSLGVYLDLVV